MTLYRTKDGIEYDLSKLSAEEMNLFNWMQTEYASASSWTEFQQRTANGIIEAVKRLRVDWQQHPLFVIQLDMVGKKGVETGKFRNELTDKL